MSIPRVRPPYVADERTQLVGWLDLQRSIILWKCEGLSEEDAHRPVLPTSPLMTVAGLVSHMRWTEHCWFEVLFQGGDSAVNPQFDESAENADMRVEGVPSARLLDEYERQCQVSNEIVAAHSLDDLGKSSFYDDPPTLRWMLIHMVEETARHAGQLDTIRELLDGTKGYY
ncbi:DinB family protein [Nonomuraea sp. NPDC049709]|uniref:DinB family protein n=1 Tax=Nonomuraea sp. NPDC049709 TaxID=3154736 RepID=UPI00342EFE0A